MEYKKLLRKALESAKANGLTRADIAKKSKVSNVTVHYWLTDVSTPNISNLTAVINACGFQLKLRME